MRKTSQRAPYPAAQERLFRAFLIGLLVTLNRMVLKTMPDVFLEASKEFRQDAWPQRIEVAVSRISASFRVAMEAGNRQILELGDEVADLNRGGFLRLVKAIVGVDFTRQDGAWLDQLMASWSRENASLIKDLTEGHISRVDRLTQDAVRSGRSMKEYRAELEKVLGVSKRRAETIARTEVSKLNGQITKARQERLGIETYTWHTSGDERVREEHRVMEGKTCRWDDATVYLEGDEWRPRSEIGGTETHPGEDVNCRCVATANVKELLDTLEAA